MVISPVRFLILRSNYLSSVHGPIGSCDPYETLDTSTGDRRFSVPYPLESPP